MPVYQYMLHALRLHTAGRARGCVSQKTFSKEWRRHPGSNLWQSDDPIGVNIKQRLKLVEEGLQQQGLIESPLATRNEKMRKQGSLQPFELE